MRISDWSSDVCSSDLQKLVEKLKQRTGEKTSSLQALGRIERDSVKGRSARHTERWDRLRDEQRADREKRKEDRKSVVWGKSVSVRVDLGGRRIIKKKNTKNQQKENRMS